MACARSEVVAGQHETAVLVHRRAEVVVVLVPSLGAQRDLGCGPVRHWAGRIVVVLRGHLLGGSGRQ